MSCCCACWSESESPSSESPSELWSDEIEESESFDELEAWPCVDSPGSNADEGPLMSNTPKVKFWIRKYG